MNATKREIAFLLIAIDFDDPRGILEKNGEIFVADGGLESLVHLASDKTTKNLVHQSPLKWPIGICNGFGENEILVSDVTNNMYFARYFFNLW